MLRDSILAPLVRKYFSMLQVDWGLVKKIVPKFSKMKYKHQHLQVCVCICLSMDGFDVAWNIATFISNLSIAYSMPLLVLRPAGTR